MSQAGEVPQVGMYPAVFAGLWPGACRPPPAPKRHGFNGEALFGPLVHGTFRSSSNWAALKRLLRAVLEQVRLYFRRPQLDYPCGRAVPFPLPTSCDRRAW